jgi:1,4-alpha-glucan branching enzyme
MNKYDSESTAHISPARTNNQKIHLSCHAPEAKAVFVAGTFNDWKADTAPLRRHSDGKWDLKLHLAPGRYEYKFLVDGEWSCEPGVEHENRDDPKCCANEFGTMNRVLKV